MNTVKCTNRLCEKEYNVEFDNCPFCGTANPIEENERRAILEKEHNDTELKPELTDSEKFSGWVTGIIWLNILFGGIRGIINSVTVMMYSPVWGAVDLGLQIIGIISLAFLLLAKKWALYLWVGYLIAVSIINGYLNNNDYSTFAIVAVIKLILMFLFLQIRKDGVSAWSIIFNKKTVDADDDVNTPQVTEDHIESETSHVVNSNDSDTIKTEAEDVLDIEEHNNGNTSSNESYNSSKNGNIQIEENIKPTEEEPANETSDKTLVITELDGSKKVIIGKWWIYPLIIIATLAIVWLVVWITHRPCEPELGKYVYVDAYDILHVDRNCKKIATIHGSTPISVYLLEDLPVNTWKHLCADCVGERYYETIIKNNNLLSFKKSKSKRDELYYNLIKSDKVTEAEIGTLIQFKEFISDESQARKFHSNLIKSGLFSTSEIGNENEFYEAIRSDFD